MNRKFIWYSLFLYSLLFMICAFIIILSIDWSITGILILVFLYLSSLGTTIYIEIWILQNHKSWWLTTIYIILVRLPYAIELIISIINKKEATKNTMKFLQLISREELPLFLYFTSFLSYYRSGKINKKIVEVGIFDNEINLALLKRLHFLGITFINAYSYKDEVTAYKCQWGKLTIMLYIIVQNRNRFIRYYFDKNTIGIYPEYKLEIKKYKWGAIPILAPASPNKYLANYYGRDWRRSYIELEFKYGPKSTCAEKMIPTPYMKKHYL